MKQIGHIADMAGKQSQNQRVTPAGTGGTLPPLVGRRFLSVVGRTPLKLSRLYDWDWRAGWIRAVSTVDTDDPDLQVCKLGNRSTGVLFTSMINQQHNYYYSIIMRYWSQLRPPNTQLI